MQKKPKTLYMYDLNMRLRKQNVTDACILEIMDHEPDGTRWHCHDGQRYGIDFYGYDTLQGAKAAEILNTVSIISERERWLKKLRGKRKS